MVDRKLGAGELRYEVADGEDLAPIVSAIDFLERRSLASAVGEARDGRRSRWRDAARREYLRR